MAQLTGIQLDFIRETINIGVGRSASILNSMLGTHIQLKVPEIAVYGADNADSPWIFDSQLSVVDLPFSGKLNGVSKLIFTQENSRKLVSVLTNSDPVDRLEAIDPLSVGVLAEIGNIVLNSVMGVVANNMNIHLDYEVPSFHELADGQLQSQSQEGEALIARIIFEATQFDISGEIAILFSTGSFRALQELIDANFDGQ